MLLTTVLVNVLVALSLKSAVSIPAGSGVVYLPLKLTLLLSDCGKHFHSQHSLCRHIKECKVQYKALTLHK